MVTTRPVKAGDELFNTYGEMGNWQLLHMYGFSEPYPNNINETVDIPMQALQEAALQGMCFTLQGLPAMLLEGFVSTFLYF